MALVVVNVMVSVFITVMVVAQDVKMNAEYLVSGIVQDIQVNGLQEIAEANVILTVAQSVEALVGIYVGHVKVIVGMDALMIAR
jgi:hypothetical protein